MRSYLVQVSTRTVRQFTVEAVSEEEAFEEAHEYPFAPKHVIRDEMDVEVLG